MTDEAAMSIGINLKITPDMDPQEIKAMLASTNKILSGNPLEIQAQLKDMDLDLESLKQINALIDSLNLSDVKDMFVTIGEAQDSNGEKVNVLQKAYVTLNGSVRSVSQAFSDSRVKVAENIETFEQLSKKIKEYVAKTSNMGRKEQEVMNSKAKAFEDLRKAYAKEAKVYTEVIKKGKTYTGNLKELEKKTLDAAEAARIQSLNLTQGANVFQNWNKRIANAIKQTITYTFTIGAMRKAQQMLNEAIQFTIQLNTEMTKIQVLQAEGAQSSQEIRALAKSFNQLGQELGATTIEIAEGSTEWLRQGKTIRETEELLRATTMMAKLGNTSMAEATELLTSTMNGFKMSTEDAIVVVDKLVHIDNIAATSTKELATALRYVAAVAHESGVTFDQLISYVAVLSETTRLNAEQIGQALKTIFARMQTIQEGGLDEDGMGLNRVERALERINVRLRDTPTSFRDLSSVLEEVAGKWSTLNEIEQANIANALGGIRQQNLLLILMTEMTSALKYQEEAYNSLGTATERYDIYLESIKAKQEQLKASMEELYINAIEDGLIKGFYDLVITIIKVMDAVGGLKTAFIALTTVMVISNLPSIIGLFNGLISAVILLITKTMGLIAVTEMYKASVTMGLSIAVALAAAAAFGIGKLIVTTKEANERIQDLNQSISQSYKDIGNINKLVKEFEELKKTISSTKEGTLEHEQATQRLVSVQNELGELLPGLVDSYDIYGNKIIETTDNVNELTVAILKRTEANRLALAVEAERNAYKRGVDLGSLRKEAELLQKIADKEGSTLKQQAAAAEAWAVFEEKLEEELPKFELMGEEAVKSFFTGIARGTGIASPLLEGLISIFDESLAKSNSERYWKAYGENWQAQADIFFAEQAQATEEQEAYDKAMQSTKENWMRAMGASEKEIREAFQRWLPDDELFEQVLPNIQKNVATVADAFKSISENELISDSQLKSLQTLKINIDYLTDGTRELYIEQEDGSKKVISSIEDYIEIELDALDETYNFTDAQRELARQYLVTKYAIDNSEKELQIYQDRLKELGSTIDLVTSALQEQTNNISENNAVGYISNETYMRLIASNAQLNQFLRKTAQGYEFNAQGAMEMLHAQVLLELKTLDLSSALAFAAAKQYDLAAAAIVAAGNISEEARAVYELLLQLENLTTAIEAGPPPTTIGGGGGEEDPQLKAYQDQIKEIQRQIRDIQIKYIRPLEKEIKKLERGPIRKINDRIKEIRKKEIRPLQDDIKVINKLIRDWNDKIKEINKSIKIHQKVIDGIQKNHIKPLLKDIKEIQKYSIKPIEIKIQGIQRGDIRRIQKEIRDIQRGPIRERQDDIKKIQREEIRPLQDQIRKIQREEIRWRQDAIKEQKKSIELIDDEIKALEKTKKPLEEQIKAFKEIIKKQKDLLKLKKDEADFNKELEKKTKNLAKIRADIALLELDTSEEARAKRLELEEQLSEAEEDITKTTEDKKYQLQLDALDKVEENFERNIQAQIDGIQEVIDARNAEKEAIQEVINALETEIEVFEDTIEQINRRIEEWGLIIEGHERYIESQEDIIENLGREIEEHENLIERLEEEIEAHEDAIEAIENQIETYEDLIEIEQEAIDNLEEKIDAIQEIIDFHEEEIDALERKIEAWEDEIEILERAREVHEEEIEKMRREIEKYQDDIDLLQEKMEELQWEMGELERASGGSFGGSMPTHVKETEDAINDVDKALLDARGQLAEFGVDTSKISDDGVIKLAELASAIFGSEGISNSLDETALLVNYFGDQIDNLSDDQIQELKDAIEKFSDSGDTAVSIIGDVVKGWTDFKNTDLDKEITITTVYEQIIKGEKPTNIPTGYYVPPEPPGGGGAPPAHVPFHQGGTVESHHNNNDTGFAGGLKSNEVFAKLLKGEYVATEGQMNNFLKNIFPKLVSETQIRNTSNTTGNISLHMPITVEGNLDSTVIPEIKNIANQVINEINKTIVRRGYIRTSNQTIS